MPISRVSKFFQNLLNSESKVEESSSVCRTCQKPLRILEKGEHGLEKCVQCEGIWIARDRLEALLSKTEGTGSRESSPVDLDGEADVGNTFAPSRVHRMCPACGEEMENFVFEGTGIWIDGCPHGHGIWLDRGELKLLAKRTGEGSKPGRAEEDLALDAVSDLILGSL